MRNILLVLVFIFFYLQSCTLSQSLLSEVANSPDKAPMNKYVMRVVKSFPTDGTCKYWWPKNGGYDGATRDVYFMGKKVMRGDPEKKNRCYCCGLTLQVFYETLNEYVRDGHTLPSSFPLPEKAKDFQHLWFCPELKSPGPVLALEKYGLGHRVTNLNDAQPGDFVQFWRNNGSGHSVIFISWDSNTSGTITGLNYWSTQKATNGIGYRTEKIGTGSRDINKDLIFIGRLDPPEKWKCTVR